MCEICNDRVSLQSGKFDDLEFPTPIYKYRDWKDIWDKRLLAELEIYLSEPISFEDKYDCRARIRYDLLSDSLMFYKLLLFAIEEFPNENMDYHIKLAVQKFRENVFTSPRQDEIDFEKFNNRMGILCLTANPRNSRMWSEYSNKDKKGLTHRGFCVGFDPKILFKEVGGGDKVNYQDELPIILPYPFNSVDCQMYRKIFVKLKQYEYEEEYRVEKMNETNHTKESRTINLRKTPKVFKEIIFGADMAQEEKDEIVNLVNKNIPHVELKQSYKIKDTIEIGPYKK